LITREFLKKKALQSNCKFKIAAFGFNSKGECVCSASNLSRFLRKGGGVHAEMRIFRQAKRKGIVKILLCRFSNTGSFTKIDPCECCSKIAKKLGIKIETLV
jgi:hypothetical protein